MAKGNGHPELGCTARLVKFSLVLFNGIFFFLGILVLAFGVFMLVDPKFAHFKNVLSFEYNNHTSDAGSLSISYLDKCGISFIIFGGVMFLISFMGCCSAIKHIRFALVVYSLVLLFLLLTEIGVGIFSAIYANKFKDYLSPTLKDSIKYEYYGDMQNKTGISISWDSIMYNFECCGINNVTDFNQDGNVWTERNNSIIPRACCSYVNKKVDWSGVIPNSVNYPECAFNPNNNISHYQIGCYDKIQNYVSQYATIAIGSGLIASCILGVCILLGFWLCKLITNANDYA